MKKTFLLLIIAGAIMSCNNEKTDATAETKDTVKTVSSAPDMNMPYTAGYSSKFAIGDQKVTQAVLTAMKQWDDNKLDDGKELFADTVQFYANGWEFNGTRDSFFAVSHRQRNAYKEVRTEVVAWIPVHSTDTGEDWALIWTVAHTIDNKGKVDSISYQDTWRYNKKGQFDLMYDYQIKAPAKK